MAALSPDVRLSYTQRTTPGTLYYGDWEKVGELRQLVVPHGLRNPLQTWDTNDQTWCGDPH
jgi:hypothetical protein